MTTTLWTISISWLAFIIYWAISAIGTKKDIAKSRWWSGRAYAVRLVIAIIIFSLVILRFPSINRIFANRANTVGSVVVKIGAVLCILGIAFAIWARFHLGKNWSSHPALKENHEMVTSGPYRFIRHPIYTGILLAELGTGLAVGYIWLIPLVLGAIIFVRRVSIEEKIMMKQFPDKYSEYKKHTKALIPFVW